MANVVSAIRKAVKAKLEGDSTLQTLCGGTVRVRYRPTRKPIELPAITMFDFGDRADTITPLWDRSLQIDVWHSDGDVAEDISQRILDLLDHKGLTLAGDEGQVARMHCASDVDATQEDTDLVRKSLRFSQTVVDYVTTYSNN